MMIVADKTDSLVLTGTGDVLTPDHGVIAIGSGGNYALSAALALAENTDLDAEAVARKAMKIAAEICVYTNEQVTLESIELD
jgi:ATP-dependent HslUV protease subunit HslV